MRQKRETVVNFVANVEALLKERECVCVCEREGEKVQKMKFSTMDLVTFTEEIFNGKL